ncbi:hypothetical protein FRB97_003663 [Tulasnella sp. 331]|nr:hypothetical protein FRB97_003663 [Tulasnella sp. 331]
MLVAAALFGLLGLASCTLARVMSISAVNKNVNMGDTVVVKVNTASFSAKNGVSSANDMFVLWGYRAANSTCKQCIGVLVATDDFKEERRSLSGDGSFTVNIPAAGAPGNWILTAGILVISGVQVTDDQSTTDAQLEYLTTHVNVNDPNDPTPSSGSSTPSRSSPPSPPSKHSHF